MTLDREAEAGPAKPRAVRSFASSSMQFVDYDSFENTYDGQAQIARLVGPDSSETLGGGIVRYDRVKTTWLLDFDEMIFVVSGQIIVTAQGIAHEAGPGDVLFFPRGTPIEYDISDSVTVFYAEYPSKNASTANDPRRLSWGVRTEQGC